MARQFKLITKVWILIKNLILALLCDFWKSLSMVCRSFQFVENKSQLFSIIKWLKTLRCWKISFNFGQWVKPKLKNNLRPRMSNVWRQNKSTYICISNSEKYQEWFFYESLVPIGLPLLQLSQEVLVEFIELWEIVQDLVEKTILNHRLPGLTRCFGHGITKVLWIRQTRIARLSNTKF